MCENIVSIRCQSTNNGAKVVWLSISVKCSQRASKFLLDKGAFWFSLHWKDDWDQSKQSDKNLPAANQSSF